MTNSIPDHILIKAFVAVLAVASLPELYVTFAQSPSPAPPLQDVAPLTPEDFLSMPSAAPWNISTSQDAITQSTNPTRWLPPKLSSNAMTTHVDNTWKKLEFPNHNTLPQLSQAHVSLRSTKTPEKSPPTCKKSGLDKFSCAPNSWAFVGPKELTVQGKKVTCTWAHPLKGKTTHIEYPNVKPPKDNSKQLVVQVAFNDPITNDPYSPVSFEISHGSMDKTLLAKNTTRGWQSIPLEFQQEEAPLHIHISAQKSGRHHLCYRFQLQPKAH